MNRILVLDTGNPAYVTGGQSAFIRSIVPHLGTEVLLGAPTYNSDVVGGVTTLQVGDAEVDFLPICRVSSPRRRPLVPVRLRCVLGSWRLRRVRGSVGCIWAHSVELAVAASLWLPRVPLVLHIHGAANPLAVSRYPFARLGIMQSVYARAYRIAMRKAARILSVDVAGVELCAQLLPGSESKAIVVPNCFDSSLFNTDGRHSARTALAIPNDDVVLLFVGRLEVHKGTGELIQALDILGGRGVRAHLYVAGEGTQDGAIRELAATLGLSAQCHLLGWLDADQLRRYLHASNVLVLPSHAEGAPTVILESLACGTPVVAADVGGVRAMVSSPAAGRVVAAPDPVALADAIQAVVADRAAPELVAASAARFDSKIVAARIREVLHAVQAQ